MKIDMKTVDLYTDGIAGVELYSCPGMPFCKSEILRSAGCKEADETVDALLEECIQEIKEQLNYRVCFRQLLVRVSGDICDFDVFQLHSEKLAEYLAGC